MCLASIALTFKRQPRKNLYLNGRGQYPTLMQKHFNGAVPCPDLGDAHGLEFGDAIDRKPSAKEAAVLAKFLKGVCLGVSAQRPHDEHAAQLDIGLSHSKLFEAARLTFREPGCDAGEFGEASQPLAGHFGRQEPSDLAECQLPLPCSL